MISKPKEVIAKSVLIILAFTNLLCSTVIISEIMPNPATNGEWIELYNYSSADVSINNWLIMDRAGNSMRVEKSHISLKGNDYAILVKDSLTILRLDLLPHTVAIVPDGWIGMNNDGDDIMLSSENGNVSDQISYSSNAALIKGRSWERIDLNKLDSDENNWGQCASNIGHTAGRPNSLYVSNYRNKMDIMVEPNPFSPDGDGIDDIVTISFKLPTSNSRISAYIYDLEANLIKQIAADLPAGPTLPLLHWVGDTKNGNTIPVGRYIIYVESLDYRTGTILSGKKVIILAKNR